MCVWSLASLEAEGCMQSGTMESICEWRKRQSIAGGGGYREGEKMEINQNLLSVPVLLNVLLPIEVYSKRTQMQDFTYILYMYQEGKWSACVYILFIC